MRRVSAGLVLLLGLSSFGDASAFWLTVNGGYNTYAMSDINNDIQSINDVTAPLQMNEISSGASYGWGLGIPVSKKVEISLSYERLYADSDVGDATQSNQYDFGVKVYKATLLYHFDSSSKFASGLSAAIGTLGSGGEIERQADGYQTLRGDVEGLGLLLEGAFVADYWVSPRVAINGSVGYRLAKVSEPEVGGNPINDESGNRLEVDYSGFALRIGLKVDFSFNKQN
ncbi:MAG: hypothetical protein Q7W05_14040 [Deltaproteobacteria bacterium]|nr:hypothetical protein [Deltaproteobacteria bacterium]